MKNSSKQIIGWREWVCLPGLQVKNIKAKVDTGARTSSMHAFDVTLFKKGKKNFVKFYVHPEQRSTKSTKLLTAEVLEFRKIKSSNGQTELRPVIMTTLNIMEQSYEIELTLTNRDEMGFRMLLGRESLRGRFLVDSGKSFFNGKPKKKKVKKLKGKVGAKLERKNK